LDTPLSRAIAIVSRDTGIFFFERFFTTPLSFLIRLKIASQKRKWGLLLKNRLPIINSKLSSNLNEAVNSSVSRNEALAAGLRILCEFINWDYGEIWMLDRDCDVLQISPTWHFHDRTHSDECRLSWRQFQLCSQEFTLHLGEGLPGRVCLSQRAEWISDVSSQSENYFLRHLIAKAFGVRAGLGIPVNIESRTQAVFVFLNSDVCKEDLTLMQQVENAAIHFSEVLARTAIKV
jgi:GAF domain